MVLFISKQDVEQWETVSNGRVPVSEKRELQTIFPSENGTCVRVAHWDDSRDFSQYIIVRLRPWMTKNSPFRTYIGHSSNRHALSGYKKRKCHTSLRNWSFPSLSTECESCSTGTTKTGCRCSKGAIAVSWTLKPLRLKPTSVAACSRPTPSSGTSTTESSRSPLAKPRNHLRDNRFVCVHGSGVFLAAGSRLCAVQVLSRHVPKAGKSRRRK
ncbi:hypothetical protein BKA81DRAFT_359033 [Phyllosticta paracitricarpa]|uniref:Uncharacterized protein n=1 Tax=Phyllosticta paracitricarpa TaxID=2016321 RepID=A0ABR1MYB9_9PEZI